KPNSSKPPPKFGELGRLRGVGLRILAVFTQLFAAKKLQRNLRTKENKKCTVVNKFSMRINQNHPKQRS
ncbi:MAG: hypothetical protein AAF587_40350, partial [Bacteroidota bacterium]